MELEKGFIISRPEVKGFLEIRLLLSVFISILDCGRDKRNIDYMCIVYHLYTPKSNILSLMTIKSQ